MDFFKQLNSLDPKIRRLINILNDPSVDPQVRKAALKHVFDQIGSAIYSKTYDMTAFDLQIQETSGVGINTDQSTGLAKQLVESSTIGNRSTVMEQVTAFIYAANASAQSDAIRMGGSLGKRRVMVRTIRNETCSWCESLAGRHENPDGQMFARHRGCDCSIKVQGYETRNGNVANYVAK